MVRLTAITILNKFLTPSQQMMRTFNLQWQCTQTEQNKKSRQKQRKSEKTLTVCTASFECLLKITLLFTGYIQRFYNNY